MHEKTFSYFSTVQRWPPPQLHMAGHKNRATNRWSQLGGTWVYLHRKMHVLLRFCVVSAKGNCPSCEDLSQNPSFRSLQGAASDFARPACASKQLKCASKTFSYFSTCQRWPPPQFHMAGHNNRATNRWSYLPGTWFYLHRKKHVLLRFCLISPTGNYTCCEQMS